MAISNNARVIFTKARNIYDVTGSLLAGMKVNHFEGQRGIVTESYTEPRLSPDVSVYDLTGGQYTADELPDGFTWYKVYTNSGEIIDVPETAIQPANANIVAVVEERLRKAQENKSFKDSEGRVSGSKKEKAAYRKILNVADLSGIELQGEALAVSLIKKDKVYPKIDIEGQKAFGASSGAVYLKTQLRSAFPNQPAISSPIMRRIYTGFAEYLYNYFANTTEVMNFIYMLQNLVDSNTLYIEFFVWHSDDQEWARKEATAYLSLYNDRLDDAEMRLNMKFDKWRHKHPEEQWIFNFKKTVSLPKTFEIDPDLAKEIQDAQENYKRILAEIPDFVNDFLSRNKLSSAYGKSGITRHLIKSYFEGRLYNFLYTRTDSVQGIFNEAFFTYQGMSEADSARLTAEKTKKDSETLAKSNVALEKAKQLVTVEQIDEFFTVNNKENDFVKVYLYRIVDAKRGKTEGEWQRYNDQPNRPEDIKRFFLKNYIRFLESDIKKLTEKIDANKKLYAPRADNWSWAEKSEGGAPAAPKADLVINKYPPLSFIKRVGGLKIDKEELENFETTKYYLQTVFGFKEFEYGQTISDKDAREIIYHFLGAMADLGEILNMDIKQLNQLGGLSMAFASRGSGSALAHYESVAKIINLTKSRGDGAVAHEYFHYLDNIVPSINNPAYSFKMWLSDIYKETSRGYYWDTSTVKNSRVNYAMQRILEFIYFCKLPQQVMEQVGLDLNQDGGYTELLTIKASDVSISKSYFGSTIEETFKNIITRHPQYKQLDRLKPKHISVLGALPKHFGLEEYAFTFTRKQSKFYSNSSKMKSDYWTRPWELLARSWETYIYDKLERAGRFNNYLVSGTYFDRSEGVYPYGKEREALFILFENLMTEFKSAYSVGDFVPFTSERVDEFIELEDSKPEKGQSKAEQKPHPIVAKFEKLIELLQNKLEDVPVDEKTDKTEAEPVNNNVTITDSMKKAARMDAIGYIAGGSVQYVESRGYEFIPCKPGEKNDGYYDLVGLVGGAKAERCIEKGVTVQRTAKVETGISPSSGNSTAFEVVEDTPSENLIEAKYIGASAPVNEALAKGSFTVIVPKSVVAVRDIEIGKNVLFVGTTGSFAKFIKAFNETGKKHDDYKIMQVVDATGTKPFAYEYDFDSKDFWRSGTAYRKGGQIKFASGGPIHQLNDRIDLLNEMLQESPDNAALSDRIELLYEMILEAEKLDGKGDPKKAWMYPVKNAEQKAHGLPVEEFTPEYLKPGKFYIAKGKEDRYYLFHESTGTTIPSVPGIYRTRIIDFPAHMGGKKVGIIFTPDRASKKREGFGSVSELKKFYNKGLTDDVESANAIKEFLSNEHVLLKEVGANIHQVEKALKDGEIQKAIDDARITYAEAYEIIQSAGLDVPLSISEKTPLEDKALARVQWKANKEGGQKYGNQEIHLLIDEAIFNKYIKPKLAADAPKTFKAYEKKYGMMYASFYRKEKQGEWQWGSMGDSLTDLEPHQDYYFNGWAIDVSSFDDPEAIAQGSTFDSDMPATWNKEPEVEPTLAEPMVVEDEKKPVRFEAGRRLNDKEKREVLRSLHDSYKVMNRPYTIETAVSESGRDYEKKVYLENATDYMIKSDITGRLLRWYIYLPDGKIAHPTELYPSISMTDAKRVQSNMEYYESLNDTAYKAVVDNLRKHNQIQAVIKLIEGAIEAGATFEKQYDSSDIGLKYPHTYLRWKGQEEPGDKYLHVRSVPEYVTLIHDKNYMGLTQKDYIDYKQGIPNKWFGYYGNIDWERFYNEFAGKSKKYNTGGLVLSELPVHTDDAGARYVELKDEEENVYHVYDYEGRNPFIKAKVFETYYTCADLTDDWIRERSEFDNMPDAEKEFTSMIKSPYYGEDAKDERYGWSAVLSEKVKNVPVNIEQDEHGIFYIVPLYNEADVITEDEVKSVSWDAYKDVIENENRENKNELLNKIESHILAKSEKHIRAGYAGSSLYCLIPHADGYIEIRLSDHLFNPQNIRLGRGVPWGEEYDTDFKDFRSKYETIFGFLSISVSYGDESRRISQFRSDFRERKRYADYPGLVNSIEYSASDYDKSFDISEVIGDIDDAIEGIIEEANAALAEGAFNKGDGEDYLPIEFKRGGNVSCECSHTGGLADGLTLQDIAIKHNVSISHLRGQLKKGIVVEREHTDSDAVAAKIAMDHLVELPDYYTRLEKMEKEPQKMAKGAQVRVTNDATDGGVFHGPSHDNGGIKGVVKETGQPIEVEGGEGILNKRTMALDEEVTLSGTPCEIASELNQMGGGVKFDC